MPLHVPKNTVKTLCLKDLCNMGVVKQVASVGGYIRLLPVVEPEPLRELPADYNNYSVYLKRVKINVQSVADENGNTSPYACGESIDVSFSDNAGKGKFFDQWSSCITYLNGTFKTEQETKGTFSISGGVLHYSTVGVLANDSRLNVGLSNYGPEFDFEFEILLID